jgi:hypothetical protein
MPAIILLAGLLWSAGALLPALFVVGSGILVSAALIWWGWAMQQHPPLRPTLFVLRHRQRHAVRLLRSVEDDLTKDIATVETLMQNLEHGVKQDQPASEADDRPDS